MSLKSFSFFKLLSTTKNTLKKKKPKHDTVNLVHFNPTTSITRKIKVSISFLYPYISQSENSMS